ncbi:MAG: hypothetical protein ACO3BD_04050 [Chitinophagaceae bacterium]
MISSLRNAYNQSFSEEKYQAFLQALEAMQPGQLDFKVCETPVFVDRAFKEKMLEACESIIDFICMPSFKELTQPAIPFGESIPNEYPSPQMIAFDFGVCRSTSGELIPQLIEMQGFPSLFAYQCAYPDLLRPFFAIPENHTHFLSGYTQASFIEQFRKIILGNHAPENVVLLEITPEAQKTRIDFAFTKSYTGIEVVCITKLIREGNDLFYMKDGKKTKIERIYNRVIFDDLKANAAQLGDIVDITSPLNVEWIPHPNWFYRISKYTLPLIRHAYVPETWFLHEIKQVPADLENYVLKPLFSFAGQGVIIDLDRATLESISNPENYILQRKVDYAAVVETPDEPAKVEIRIMYWWPEGDARPHAAINLARLSKGKMVGVRYNKEKTWVGGSVAFFEQ